MTLRSHLGAPGKPSQNGIHDMISSSVPILLRKEDPVPISSALIPSQLSFISSWGAHSILRRLYVIKKSIRRTVLERHQEMLPRRTSSNTGLGRDRLPTRVASRDLISFTDNSSYITRKCHPTCQNKLEMLYIYNDNVQCLLRSRMNSVFCTRHFILFIQAEKLSICNATSKRTWLHRSLM